MTEAILIFTFSPIQPFIAEARRAEDLFAGSDILSQLAKAAARTIGLTHLIYPTDLGQDAPNKLVAKVPYNQAEELAKKAEQALKKQWQEAFVVIARDKLAGFQPMPDSIWLEIWYRQTNNYWECHWAFAPYNGQDYEIAYRAASHALDAAKRTRRFTQCAEAGIKDTLSGQRSALRLEKMDAKTYWGEVAKSPKITAAELRPEGKERLDALGAVKRFGLSGEQTFLSVSSVATADFLVEARRHSAKLELYRQTVKALLGRHLYEPCPQDKDWPYDGDLFFMETLTPDRLEDSYGYRPEATSLEPPKAALKALCKEVGWQPRPYYALLLMDGDGIGELVDKAAKKGELGHKALSQAMSGFAKGVNSIVTGKSGHPIYSGGDDVFALAPVSTALAIGQALQAKFNEKIEGGTASAGIVIAHHLYPLSAALQAAHEAEGIAKHIEDKSAIAVRVLKRSGETLEVRSKWKHIPVAWNTLITYFQQENGPLSSKFAYSVVNEARIVTCLDEAAQKATLRRLIGRHKARRLPESKIKELEEMGGKLAEWARQLDLYISPEKVENQEVPQGFTELGRWLLLARFMAQRGGD